MFYKFLKVLVGFSLRIFFRRVYITGLEHIHPGKPQLIASNHPNGFLEPLLMACYFPKDLHFLVRGDVFENPFLLPVLRATHQIPVFRFRDGFSKLRENASTIDESLEVLKAHENLLIFVEGGTESVKKLRPLQKGIARIAFQALDKNPELPLEIVPVGINFTHPEQFNEEVMVRISTPIQVKNYYSLYLEDKNAGTQKLLDDLHLQMREQVIHIENLHRTQAYEKMAAIQRNMHSEPLMPITLTRNDRLNREIELANEISLMDEPEWHDTKLRLDRFENQIRKIGLHFSSLPGKPMGFSSAIFLFLALIPALAGLLGHALPLSIAYYFTTSKVTHKEFRASILFVSSILLVFLYYIVIFVLVLTNVLPVIILPALWLTGLIAKLYVGHLRETLFITKKQAETLHKSSLAFYNP
jgi:glycerol-3-phosphate O-acyltransferase/dihydroxyacetone phosphate acyltransferase